MVVCCLCGKGKGTSASVGRRIGPREDALPDVIQVAANRSCSCRRRKFLLLHIHI